MIKLIVSISVDFWYRVHGSLRVSHLDLVKPCVLFYRVFIILDHLLAPLYLLVIFPPI